MLLKLQIPLTKISLSESTYGVCSLPVLPGLCRLSTANAVVQSVPVGFWPTACLEREHFRAVWAKSGWRKPPPLPTGLKWPRRLLTFLDFGGYAPPMVTLDAEAAEASVAGEQPSAGWQVRVLEHADVRPRTEQAAHYCRDEGKVELSFGGGKCNLQFGFQLPNRVARWQWVNAQRLWGGPIAEAWQVGGHIYAGAHDRPLTPGESARWQESEFADEQTIMVKVFLVLLRNGCADVRAHFINGELYGRGGLVCGKPLICIESPDGIATSDKTKGRWRICSETQAPFGGDGPGAFRRTESGVEWLPFADTRQMLGKREDRITAQRELVFVPGSEQGFPRGTARTAVFPLAFDSAAAPARYLASPEHYFLAAEFGIPLRLRMDKLQPPAGFESLPNLSSTARTVFLRNEMKEGFATGGTFRYLDQYPDGCWEFSCDGNETASFYRGSYLGTDAALFQLAQRNADFHADLCCNHADFTWHYHKAQPDRRIYSLIYMRFGGLVHAFLETGDPYYLETAEAVANRWIAIHRANWPRRSVGRDVEPVEGILLLYDFTGQDHYLDVARQIARDVVLSLYPDGLWRSGAGVGPFWGVNALPGTPWNGSHLLAGLVELLLRCDPSDPLVPELLDGGKRLLHRMLKMLDATGYFHRATASFAWRRHYFLSTRIDEPTIRDGIHRLLRTTLKQFEQKGEKFFVNGHHCAGYIDNPWFFLASESCSRSRRHGPR